MLWTSFKSWLHRRWRGERREHLPFEEPSDFDIDRLAKLLERGDLKDFKEIVRRMQN